MKAKKILLLLFVLIFSKILAQETEHKEVRYLDYPFWYVGLGYSVPMFYGDLYSWNQRDFYWGNSFNVRAGRQFSSAFGLEASLSYGWNKVSSPKYAYRQQLGIDGMTYYRYTLIDGSTYYSSHPTGDLTGYQGNNQYDNKMNIAGTPYQDIYNKVSYWQLGVQPVFNLNRLLSPYALKDEQRFTFFLKPGVYLQWFTATPYHRDTDKVIAPKQRNEFSIGLGADLSLRYRFYRRWSAELYTGLNWISDNDFEAVRTKRLTHDSYMWNSGVTLMYKFGHPKEEIRTIEEPVPTKEIPVKPLLPDFEYAFVSPAPEKNKIREVKLISYLNFHLDKWFIDPNLTNNPAELRKIDSVFTSISNDKDVRLHKIIITGWASPEGEAGHNYMLSVNRSGSLANYIKQKYHFTEIETSGKGEDWDGLYQNLKDAPHFAGREEALSVLDNLQEPSARKSAMKKLPQYRYLIENWYPKSRRNQSQFVFSVRSYSLEEAREIIKTEPHKLSLSEMWAVAQADADTEKQAQIVDILAQTHPDALETKLNQIVLALRNKDIPQADYLLKSIAITEPKSWNLRGVWYAMNKEYDFAKFYFLKALGLGDDFAKQNLQLLEQIKKTNE